MGSQYSGGAVKGASAWIDGLEDDGHQISPDADMETNNLHRADGPLCPLCGRAILPGQPVRRRVTGEYQHDSC
jgi:hypothetical protein